MISVNYVTNAFGWGISVPLPKSYSKGHSYKVADYRGITILPIILKLLEFYTEMYVSIYN